MKRKNLMTKGKNGTKYIEATGEAHSIKYQLDYHYEESGHFEQENIKFPPWNVGLSIQVSASGPVVGNEGNIAD